MDSNTFNKCSSPVTNHSSGSERTKHDSGGVTMSFCSLRSFEWPSSPRRFSVMFTSLLRVCWSNGALVNTCLWVALPSKFWSKSGVRSKTVHSGRDENQAGSSYSMRDDALVRGSPYSVLTFQTSVFRLAVRP